MSSPLGLCRRSSTGLVVVRIVVINVLSVLKLLFVPIYYGICLLEVFAKAVGVNVFV